MGFDIDEIGPLAVLTVKPLQPNIVTRTVTIKRPADTSAYTANDAFCDATSSPTQFSFQDVVRTPGGAGRITDAIVSLSASTALQGEIWLFDQPVTAIADNAAFDVTDIQVLSLVGIIPFTVTDITASNAVSYITGLDIRFNCMPTSTSLYFLVKVMNAPTPGNAEIMGLRIKVEN